MARRLLALWGDETGLASVEYSLLLALVVAVTVVSWENLGCATAWAAARAAIWLWWGTAKADGAAP